MLEIMKRKNPRERKRRRHPRGSPGGTEESDNEEHLDGVRERKEHDSGGELVESDLIALPRGSRHTVRDQPAQAVRHPPRHGAEDGYGKTEEEEEKRLERVEGHDADGGWLVESGRR